MIIITNELLVLKNYRVVEFVANYKNNIVVRDIHSNTVSEINKHEVLVNYKSITKH
jgi:hypothetical protein